MTNYFIRWRSGAWRMFYPAFVSLIVLWAAPSLWADDAVPANVASAIDSGLTFLANQQQADGSFPSAEGTEPAATSLAVLAFLARGYTPAHGPYHDVIDKAIDWVISIQQPDGYLIDHNGQMYDHGISTVMLSEVYGMVDPTQQPRVAAALSKAVGLILQAQNNSGGNFDGGWRYQPNSTDADISCTGWQLMALRGAADCGADLPPDAIRRGIEFVERDACPQGGFAYMIGGGPNQARSGTGILALELLGRHEDPAATNAGDWLLANPLRTNSDFYFYAVYYCSQAVNQLGGQYWNQIYPQIRQQLLDLQFPDGSWTPPDGIEQQGGKIYATSMAILALCVPYHYLPLYQR
ncbi:MAG TPA: prenyltransferase/squalene oxidase repeat-containing protein [Phycisphaerae bacterium]|nr:prenyltransferase/squalene oxidase repeat-containing protein [Phycisphaerae bacterium]